MTNRVGNVYSAPRLCGRVDEYKKLILNAPYEVCIERARLYTESFRRTEGQHPSLRAARAFEHCLRRMSVYILDSESLVGNRTSKIVGTPLPVERGDISAVIEMDLDSLLQRERQPYHIDPADRRELFEQILPYWRTRSLRAAKRRLWKEQGIDLRMSFRPGSIVRRWRSLNMRTLLDLVRSPEFKVRNAPQALDELAYNNPGMVMNVFDVQGHLVLGLRNVVPMGLEEVKRRALERLERCRVEQDADGIAFCEAAAICCDAVVEFAARFAALARDQAASAAQPRKAELLEIAARCERVPAGPPCGFADAVQSMWMVEAAAIVAYGMAGILAVGRPDQYLYPYYKADIDAGRIDRPTALALVQELLVKLSSNLLMIPYGGKKTGSELGADSNAVTVGGLGPDGADATNELSELFLDAVAAVHTLGNTFTIRISERSPAGWLRKTAEVFSATSGPAVFNDEKVVQALIGCGYAPEHARDYAVIGCVEPTADGNSFACTSGNDISLAGALEMALNRGRLFIMGNGVGPDTGDPRGFADFEQLMQAYKRQVGFMIDMVARAVNLKDQAYAAGFHSPFVSLTVDGCLDKARDLTQGGARYNFSSISGRGLGTAADSLAAIKYAVYEQRKLSMDELLKALGRDYRGDEALRQFLLHKTPKYGRDDERADAIAREIVGYFCREVARHRGFRGGPFRPSFFSYGMHVLEGAFLGATPDGRRAGEPLSNSLSPSNGAETAGPTGVLRSLAKLDQSLISNGCAVNIKLLPSLLATAERRDKFISLIRGYFDLGGMEAAFNVVDNATLREAQAHPEKYPDLSVRVSGYAALFVDLGSAIQDEIIRRTEFERI